MNRKFAVAVFVLPLGMSSLLAKSASAAEAAYQPDAQPPIVVAQRYDNRWDNNQRDQPFNNRSQRYRDQQEAIRREEARRNELRRDQFRRDQERRDTFQRDQNRWNQDRGNQNRWNQNRRDDQRVWVPGHYESGFLGIGRRWVEGHWATGR